MKTGHQAPQVGVPDPVLHNTLIIDVRDNR